MPASGLVASGFADMISDVSAKLKMVECGHCHAKTFIPADLPPMETTPCAKCGHPVMAPVTLRHFELRSVIASGGMGTVYRAFDNNLHREVAVKILKPEMASDPEIMASFFREARAGADTVSGDEASFDGSVVRFSVGRVASDSFFATLQAEQGKAFVAASVAACVAA